MKRFLVLLAFLCLSAPAVAATISDLRSQKFALGVTITSLSDPTLNATYPVQKGDQTAIEAIVLYIVVNNKFPASQTTWPWPDRFGTEHAFTKAQFLAFASAVADYVAGVELQLNSQAPVWPDPSATIP